MKHLTTIKLGILKVICIIFTILPLDSFSQEKQATLNETIEWLKPKLSGEFVFNTGNARYDCSVDFNYKTCTMTYKLDGIELGKKSVKLITIPLKNINVKDIKYDSKYRIITLLTNNKERLITQDEIYGDLREVTKENGVILYYLYGSDSTNAERIKNALIHAIKLCGGKGEAF